MREKAEKIIISCVFPTTVHCQEASFQMKKMLLWIFKPFSMYHVPWLGSFWLLVLPKPSTL